MLFVLCAISAEFDSEVVRNIIGKVINYLGVAVMITCSVCMPYTACHIHLGRVSGLSSSLLNKLDALASRFNLVLDPDPHTPITDIQQMLETRIVQRRQEIVELDRQITLLPEDTPSGPALPYAILDVSSDEQKEPNTAHGDITAPLLSTTMPSQRPYSPTFFTSASMSTQTSLSTTSEAANEEQNLTDSASEEYGRQYTRF